MHIMTPHFSTHCDGRSWTDCMSTATPASEHACEYLSDKHAALQGGLEPQDGCLQHPQHQRCPSCLPSQMRRGCTAWRQALSARLAAPQRHALLSWRLTQLLLSSTRPQQATHSFAIEGDSGLGLTLKS